MSLLQVDADGTNRGAANVTEGRPVLPCVLPCVSPVSGRSATGTVPGSGQDHAATGADQGARSTPVATRPATTTGPLLAPRSNKRLPRPAAMPEAGLPGGNLPWKPGRGKAARILIAAPPFPPLSLCHLPADVLPLIELFYMFLS